MAAPLPPSPSITSRFRPFLPALGPVLGHAWTISSFVTRARSQPWRVEPLHLSIPVDSDLGPDVRLRAALHRVPQRLGVRPLLVLIHGLGGSAESGYMRAVTNAALARDVSTLRVSLRGADEHGWDFYHAGLTDDVLHVLEDPHLSEFDSVAVFGISLGGHVTLRAAADRRLPFRVTSVAALCPPLDLEASVTAFDVPGQWLYRRHVLGGLKQMYTRFLSHPGRGTPVSSMPGLKEANAISLIRDWDEKIVAPRHGFANASAYYRSETVSTRLHAVNVPSLVVTTRWDPMVPRATTQTALAGTVLSKAALDGAESWVTSRVFPKLVHWELPSGGHVAWPAPRPPERSVIEHILDWLWAPAGILETVTHDEKP